MLISKVKSYQVTILFPLRKIFSGAMVILLSFLQAGNKNDSIDSRNFEIQVQRGNISILYGTNISGAEVISNAEIIIIKKEPSYKDIVKPPLRKSKITKKEISLRGKKIDKERCENKIAISNEEQQEKYKYWLIKLRATKESEPYQYDFSLLTLPVFLELLCLKKTKINFFRNFQKTFLPDRYCCIRPPPTCII